MVVLYYVTRELCVRAIFVDIFILLESLWFLIVVLYAKIAR